MVSVLSIEPNVRGFKPGRGQLILRAIKVRNTPTFRREVIPSNPLRNILRHVKYPYIIPYILCRLNSMKCLTNSLLRYLMPAATREYLWMNQD
jgi:hypothetical protein